MISHKLSDEDLYTVFQAKIKTNIPEVSKFLQTNIE